LDFYDIDELYPCDNANVNMSEGTRIFNFEDYRIHSTYINVDYYYICNLTNLIIILISNIINDRKYDSIINDIIANKINFTQKLTEDKFLIELFENLNTAKLLRIKISKYEWDKEISINRILLFIIFLDNIFEFSSEIEFDFSAEKIDKYFNDHNTFLQTKCELIQNGADIYRKVLTSNAILSNKLFSSTVKFQSFKIIGFDSYFSEMIFLKNKYLKNIKSGINYLNYIDNLERIENLQYFGIEFNSFDKFIFKNLNHLFLFNLQISSLKINFFPSKMNKSNFYKTCLNNTIDKIFYGILTKNKDMNLITNEDGENLEEEFYQNYISIYNKLIINNNFNSYENFDANFFMENIFQEYSNKFSKIKYLDVSNESVICEIIYEDFSKNLKDFLIILNKRISKLKYLSLSFQNVEFVNNNEKFNCLLGCFIYSLFSLIKNHEKEIDMIKFELDFGNLKFDFLRDENKFPIIDLSKIKIYDFSLSGEIKEFYNKIIFPFDFVSILKLNRIDLSYVDKENFYLLNNKLNINKPCNFNKYTVSYRKITKICLEFNVNLVTSIVQRKSIRNFEKELIKFEDDPKKVNESINIDFNHNKKSLLKEKTFENILENEVEDKNLFKYYYAYFSVCYGDIYELLKEENRKLNGETFLQKNIYLNLFQKICESEALLEFFYNLLSFEKFSTKNIFYDNNNMEFSNFYRLLKFYLISHKDISEEFELFVIVLNIIDQDGINLILLLNLIYLYDHNKVNYRIKLRYLDKENFTKLSEEQQFFIVTFDYKNKRILELGMNQLIVPYNFKMGLFLLDKFKLPTVKSLSTGNMNKINNNYLIIKNIKEFVQENYFRKIDVFY